MKAKLLLLCVATCLAPGCQQDPGGEVDAYTISRSGVMFQDEQFDVVDVYGFSDNQAMAREIAEYLNRQEPNTYRYRKKE
ncbi:hypothetical protein J2T57_001619 [Natronocella acetinitrilica]|uniref:Uncharacterized protein n=1 Tax=Natronocella acetinitrilica TaxID=414046 RepID=A0AAE3G604_9GAMM|nr:hypothetical protein [Natronocella acetinitrilica]MCP1674517.1 hypothetical protein [Natronocella acetinitrilica]